VSCRKLSQLEGVLALAARNVGTTYMSTAHLLHAYRFPEVLATATDGFTADHLLDGSAGTLYLTSSSRHQKMLAPILVALVSSVLDTAIEKSRKADAPLDPLLRVLLDETANCAPLQTLPGHLSDVAAYGVRIATVWQSIAQMRDRYGDAKDAIMAPPPTRYSSGRSRTRRPAMKSSTFLGNKRSASMTTHYSAPRQPRRISNNSLGAGRW
jgi:hypothetical protein